MSNKDAIRLSAQARQLRQQVRASGSRTVHSGDIPDAQAVAERNAEWHTLRNAFDATLDTFMAYPIPDQELYRLAERMMEVLDFAGTVLDTIDGKQAADSDIPAEVPILGPREEPPAKELIGVNDHLPRMPENEASQAAGHIRIRQGDEGWHYPIHLRRWQPENNRPADCPQCFGSSERCPLGTADHRLCPHMN